MSGPLHFCRHFDGYVHPIPPYPEATHIEAGLLEQLDSFWRDPDDTDILVFAPDCRYMICEYRPEVTAFVLSRVH